MLAHARSLAGALCLAVSASPLNAVAAQQPPAPLLLEATIPLPDTSGRIDHLAIDLRRGRLFVAELGNGTVDIVDLASRKVAHRLSGLNEPQGIGYSPVSDTLAVASRGDGSVRLFRGADLAPAGIVQLGSDADNVRVDASGHFVVGYGDGSIAAIDPVSRTVLSEAKLTGHPEGFQIEPSGRAIVNVPDARQIAVVDPASGRQMATWRVPGFGSNFPMALTRGGRMVAAVFRSPPRLVLLDTSNGAVVQSLQTCGEADDVFFDERRHRIYVSCGSGSVAVAQDGYGGYRNLSLIPTSSGARTSLFVPELDRLFVAKRAELLGGEAAILVLRPQGDRAD
jgi:DNA-binding beta-propeller fold protein YncE